MAFDTLKIHGAGDINYVMATSLELTDTDINALQASGLTAPVWAGDTIMLADFHEDTYANSATISNDIVGYKIQRYEVDYDRLYDVATIDNENMYFEDYNLKNHKSYQYRIVPIYVKDGIEMLGAPIPTETVLANWCGWTVIGTKPTREKDKYTVDKDNIWRFGLNVEAEPIYPVFNKNYITGFGRFPKEVRGEENYLEGKMSCLIGDVECDNYTGDTIDVIEKWRSFCNNGELKLLKDLKGHIIPCTIKDTTSSINYKVLDQITTISFSFVQLKEARDISVFCLEV